MVALRTCDPSENLADAPGSTSCAKAASKLPRARSFSSQTRNNSGPPARYVGPNVSRQARVETVGSAPIGEWHIATSYSESEPQGTNSLLPFQALPAHPLIRLQRACAVLRRSRLSAHPAMSPATHIRDGHSGALGEYNCLSSMSVVTAGSRVADAPRHPHPSDQNLRKECHPHLCSCSLGRAAS